MGTKVEIDINQAARFPPPAFFVARSARFSFMETESDFRRTAVIYSLRQAAIFSGLPDEDLRRIASYATLRRLAASEYLFRQGDPVVGFYIVRNGLINVHRISAQGQEQIIHLLRQGESFAERAFASEIGYPANARAAGEAEVLLIPTEAFKLHQRERPDLAWRMISSMSHHLKNLVTALEGLKYHEVEMRVLHWLLQHCSDPTSSSEIEIRLATTKASLAARLATRPETLSRTFRELRSAGLITVRSREIVVVDPALLYARFQTKLENLNHRGRHGAGFGSHSSIRAPQRELPSQDATHQS
jgi:CRP/FNR family transcriptional regulator